MAASRNRFAANLVFVWGIRFADVFYLPLSARRRLTFFCFAKKKVSKEKATRRRKISRANCRHPGAANPLRSKEGGLYPGWRQFARLAPTGLGALVRFWFLWGVVFG
ncbi:hypothetical protein [Vogesella indigofera]|uniref:hypothetical protein n=1 Tax=Vogesella indigofera TaxID=45465 RepID=UPI00234D484B|nr:hypothetical protein [Vogesella indigofera]MDC7703174.1 hypothetical protein [Vogesella indigofera]